MPFDYKALSGKNDSEDKTDSGSFMDQVKDVVTGKADQVQPGDEKIYPNSPRNFLIDRLGLPDNWKQSSADEKLYWQNLPMNMAMMGTVKPVGAGIGATAEEALANAPASAVGRLGQVIKPEGDYGSVTVQPEPAPSLGAPSQGYINLMRRRLLGGR